MKLVISLAIIVALCVLFTSLPTFANTDYYLDRSIVGCSDKDGVLDTQNVYGDATVEDSGAYTPITHLTLSGSVCQNECDPQTQEPYGTYIFDFPEGTSCSCVNLDIDEDVTWNNDQGSIYRVGSDQIIHVIRRGSDETGDPSLLVNVDGATYIFRELSEPK